MFLDLSANLHRSRKRPDTSNKEVSQRQEEYAVEIAYQEFIKHYALPETESTKETQ